MISHGLPAGTALTAYPAVAAAFSSTTVTSEPASAAAADPPNFPRSPPVPVSEPVTPTAAAVAELEASTTPQDVQDWLLRAALLEDELQGRALEAGEDIRALQERRELFASLSASLQHSTAGSAEHADVLQVAAQSLGLDSKSSLYRASSRAGHSLTLRWALQKCILRQNNNPSMCSHHAVEMLQHCMLRAAVCVSRSCRDIGVAACFCALLQCLWGGASLCAMRAARASLRTPWHAPLQVVAVNCCLRTDRVCSHSPLHIPLFCMKVQDDCRARAPRHAAVITPSPCCRPRLSPGNPTGLPSCAGQQQGCPPVPLQQAGHPAACAERCGGSHSR
jgi:hypothetical protein